MPTKRRNLTVHGARVIALSTLIFGCAGGVDSDPAADPPGNPGAFDSGVRGTVLLGPLTPGPTRDDQPPGEAPFRAVFLVLGPGDTEVARFESNDAGDFEVRLAPGDYTIVPDATAPLMAPARQRHPITVPAGELAEVTLRFDTGMR